LYDFASGLAVTAFENLWRFLHRKAKKSFLDFYSAAIVITWTWALQG